MDEKIFRQGATFVRLTENGLVVHKHFPSINAAKRENRSYGYPVLPHEKPKKARRH